jgi:hypothetical protein
MPRFNVSKISFFPLCFFLTAWLGGKPHFIEIAVTGVVDSLVDLGA